MGRMNIPHHLNEADAFPLGSFGNKASNVIRAGLSNSSEGGLNQ